MSWTSCSTRQSMRRMYGKPPDLHLRSDRKRKNCLSVALARRLHTEIISADSMQIYRGMDIGTAKPTERSAGRAASSAGYLRPGEPFPSHGMLSWRTPQRRISCPRHDPVVAGGTGLYMDALIECSTFTGDETDLSIREKYQRMAAEQGNKRCMNACGGSSRGCGAAASQQSQARHPRA